MLKTSPYNPQPQTRPSISTNSDVENNHKASNNNNNNNNDEGGSKTSRVGEENACTIIDMMDVDDEEEEKVCRICQMGRSDEVVEGGVENGKLMDLGCNCKGDLALAHFHCAYAWFLHQGNRACEICRKPAKNIIGIDDTGYRAFGSEIGIESPTIANPSDYSRHRCSSILCNIMLTVLVMAFLFLWITTPKFALD
ncbi:hypothetical protein vseg_015378 [Gypsophila vaccaria]